ncbi:MAG TPA: cation:proton antiporter [Planctomycetota bacterium]|nr:cation:proton antiporter [Planctomycetota bacterium]
MNSETHLILSLTTALLLALMWGYFTHRLGLSTIVGYLLAGIAVGQTPGLLDNRAIPQNLADIGVILLMFAIGSHFHLKDLLAVRAIAVPGALIQSMCTTTIGTVLTHALGFTWMASLVLGMSISVASTVVLIRVLVSNKMLQTIQGHVAVGWLIVEDIITVLFLVLLTGLQSSGNGGELEVGRLAGGLGLALVKLAIFVAGTFYIGARVIPWLMIQVAKTRSTELFTLMVLVVALSVALTSTLLFGASMALGAFLAGMVVGQSEVSHQAAADVLPMRDAFAVLFFVSVGMLFDPHFVVAHPGMILAVLGIILVLKPLMALTLVTLFGYSVRTALVVALGLTQIGEFSFILAKFGIDVQFLPAHGQSLLVACALFSVTLNPLLFKLIRPLERWLQNQPRLWRLLNARADRLGKEAGLAQNLMAAPEIGSQRAVVVGYGPVGRTVTRILKDFGVEPVVVELNVQTVAKLKQMGIAAVYGDACRREILKAAGIAHANFLIITLPDLPSRIPVIAAARGLNPNLRILVRAHYLGEREMLKEIGASVVIYEEAESAVALAGHLLREIGANEEIIRAEGEKIRNELAPQPEAALSGMNGTNGANGDNTANGGSQVSGANPLASPAALFSPNTVSGATATANPPEIRDEAPPSDEGNATANSGQP